MTTDSGTARNARVQAAGDWFAGLPSGARPRWDDVLVVAAMDLTDQSVLTDLLIGDPETLIGQWRPLQDVLDGCAGRGAAPAVATTDDRLAALTRWRDDQQRRGRFRGLSDVDLYRIAGSGAVRADEVAALWLRARRIVSEHAAEISAVLSAVTGNLDRSGQDAAVTVPAPATVPAAAAVPAPATVPAAAAVPTAVTGVAEPGTGTEPNRATNAAMHPITQPPEAAPTDPGPLPRAHPPRTGPTPAGLTDAGWLADVRFARYSWDTQADVAAAAALRAVTVPEGVRLTWPASPAERSGWFAYRVVSGDEYAPDSSADLGTLVGATRQTHAVDAREPGRAVRHYAIWVNCGPDEATARSSQPLLHARGRVVLPVTGFSLRVEGDRVFGRWTPPAGSSGVKVTRVPTDLVAVTPTYDASFSYPDQISVKPGGFTDIPGAGGVFEYRVFTVVTVDGQDALSEPVTGRVTVEQHVDAVDDLVVDQQGDGRFTLTWSTPRAGQVEVYRLPEPPPEGLEGMILSRAALPGDLNPGTLLAQPVDQDGRRARMADVALPPRWTRAFFVPVTVLDAAVLRVGTTAVQIMPTAPTQVRCLERVRAQVLTFAWPERVEFVRVYVGPLGAPASATRSPMLVQQNRGEYDEHGGIHLPTTLPEQGCLVHLYGATFFRGQPVLSEPATISYPGLYRVEYQVHADAPPSEPAPRAWFGRERVVTPAAVVRRFEVWSRYAVSRLRLVGVHNLGRLPLSENDGQRILEEEVDIEADQAMLLDTPLPNSGTGYLRLFVIGLPVGHPPVAVMDPEIGQLRL